MARRFEWNKRKATSNAKKHGVTFDEALLAFDDPFALIEVDFTERETNDGLSVLRIIGARKATKNEREAYEAQRAV